jgi:uncharacterized protein (TIGR02246 family)
MLIRIIALVQTALVTAACAGKGSDNMSSTHEQLAIIAETEAFAGAWNRGDARAAAAFFTEDGARVGAFGDVQRGREEIEAAYERLLHTSMPGARVIQERGRVRMLTPELALWQGGIEILPPDGRPALQGHVVQVMKKVGGRWLILESHPKLFPAPPPPSSATASLPAPNS